jgi:hypothetical protein
LVVSNVSLSPASVMVSPLDFLFLSPAVASGASTPSLRAEGEAIQESRTGPGLLRQLCFLAMTA